jgi:Na+-driven multidrug efflux pump
MSFIYQASKSVAATTGSTSVSGTMSTYLNGLVSSVYVAVSSACGANEKVILSAATSTSKAILTVVNPSTLGVHYYPRALAQGTTANTLPSSNGVAIPLYKEQVKITVESSSSDKPTATVLVNVI